MFWFRKKEKSDSEKSVGITFEFYAPQASSVFLAGDFNSWSTVAAPLTKDSTGRWKIYVKLSPGRHEYRFIVDGEWQNDQRPVYLVDNEYGSKNCLIEV